MYKFLFRISFILSLMGLVTSYVAVENYKERKIKHLYTPFPSRYVPRNEGVDLLLFGDSRADRWNTTIFEKSGLLAGNAGIASDVTVSMLNRLEQNVINLNPQVVVIAAGINDIVIGSLMETDEDREQNLNSTIANLNDIVKRLLQADISVIILTISPPLKPDLLRKVIWGDNINRDVSRVNEAIKALEQENVYVVDVITVFKMAGKTWIDLCRLDTLHYTPLAYDLLSKKISFIVKGNK